MVPSLLCTFVAHITFLHVFFLPPPFILSLSLAFSFSLSLYLCPLFLSVVARHMSSDALYQIFSSWSILLFHTISFHSPYKIHQLFTDYLLRLSSSELLEKHLFRSRANRRLVQRGGSTTNQVGLSPKMAEGCSPPHIFAVRPGFRDHPHWQEVLDGLHSMGRVPWWLDFGAGVVLEVETETQNWLVVSNIWIIFHFIYGMSSQPHWRTPSFFRGVGIPMYTTPTSFGNCLSIMDLPI